MKTFAMRSMEISLGQVLAVMPGYPKVPVSAVEADVLLVPDQLPLVPTRRMVVLVPPGEIDENRLTRRIWQLAVSSGLQVCYLALAPKDEHAATQRRRLIGLAAGTKDKEIHAQINLSAEKSWPQALGNTLQPGDLLVCLAGHQVTGPFFRRQALGELLAGTMNVPVYLLGGLKAGPSPQLQSLVTETLAWTASLSLMAAFFALQVGIERTAVRPISTIMLILSVLVELYFLWKINEWVG